MLSLHKFLVNLFQFRQRLVIGKWITEVLQQICIMSMEQRFINHGPVTWIITWKYSVNPVWDFIRLNISWNPVPNYDVQMCMMTSSNRQGNVGQWELMQFL